MRFNGREITKVCNELTTPSIEGVLFYMKPQGNDWSDWYQQPSFKERTFKLVFNMLFYYRVNETEPQGVFVLENVQVAYEQPRKGIFYAFSITFSDGKHVFACRCEEDVNKWVSALKSSPYEHWRSQLIILKTKLSMKTGKDPVLEYMRSKQPPSPPKRRKNRSMFYTETKDEIEEKSFSNGRSFDNVPVNKLIDF
ncbi:pleckstrin homology domain-containing family J member 1-like [Onthophagus taurus]|uniref:pleckstrin homology domain-containing family J member 1-like n=1 Tax=Onthophagus taurus TaxID=166361 RepID=UPI000C20CC87|nr:pleckstrin homology domain-containing family J member 1-like [Onthophagus taurus]